jgi:hypothetical protein
VIYLGARSQSGVRRDTYRVLKKCQPFSIILQRKYIPAEIRR